MIHYQKDSLTIFQSALQQTTCTVFEGNDFILVVDPNWLPQEIEEIQQHVQTRSQSKEVYLLFTHGDFDHIIGYQAFPNAKVIGSIGLQQHPHKEKKVNLAIEFDQSNYIERSYPIAFPEVDIVITEDGQKVQLGDTILTFYLSPGHTHDGLFTVIEPHGIWIAGDYLSDFELPFINDSVVNYQQTLQKAERILSSHVVNILIPGHGKLTEDRNEIRRRIDTSQNYLNRLIQAVKNSDEEELHKLEKMMPFPSGFTKESHRKNVAFVQKAW